jgi:hypothetical protein
MVSTDAARPYVIGVRMSALERRALEGMAEQDQSSLSEVIRRAITREAMRALHADTHGAGDADTR